MKKKKQAKSYDDMLAEIRSQWKTKYRKLLLSVDIVS